MDLYDCHILLDLQPFPDFRPKSILVAMGTRRTRTNDHSAGQIPARDVTNGATTKPRTKVRLVAGVSRRAGGLGLGLAACTTEERYQKVIEAIDSGMVSIRDGARLVDVVKAGISVADAAEFKRRLFAAEAAHRASLEATRSLAAARPRQARSMTVDVSPVMVPSPGGQP